MSTDRKILFVAPRWRPVSTLKRHISTLAKRANKVIVLTKVPMPDGEVNRLKQLGCSAVRPLDSYLNHQEIDKIREETVRLIEGLPQASSDFARAVEYNGISLWQLAEMATFYPVYDVVRCLEALSHALEQEKPDEVWAWQDRGANLFWHDIPWRSLGAFANYWLHSRVIDYNEAIAQLATSAGVKFRPLVLPAWFRTVAPLAGRTVAFAYRLYLAHQEHRNFKRSNRATGTPLPGVEDGVMIMSGGASADYVAIPVAQAIKNRECTQVFVTRLTGQAGSLECGLLDREKVRYMFYQEFATEEVFSVARKARNRLVTSWREIERHSEIGQHLKWQDISVGPALKRDVGMLFGSYFPALAKDIEVLDRIMQRTRPKALLITNYYSAPERAAIMLARIKNIRTLLLTFFPLTDGLPPIPVLVEKMALWGEDMRQFLLDHPSMAPKRMVLTGNPAFEYRLKRGRLTLGQANEDNVTAERHNRVLFISQAAQQDYTEEKRRIHLEAVYNATRLLPDIQFTIRLHPMESGHAHFEFIKNQALRNATIENDLELYRAILANDLVMTFSSTAGIEAMLLDKPLIAINLVGESVGRIPYLRDGAAYGVYEGERLPQAIKLVLGNPNIRQQLSLKRQEFLRRYLYQFDGQSANRIAVEILDMVGETR